MHASVHEFFKTKTKETMFKGKKVLEVGSQDVNGSVRGFVTGFKPKEYLGTDLMAGSGVDRVLSAEKLAKELGAGSFDVVISTEMLEHAENWRSCVNNMKDVTSGLLIITTRSPGFPKHDWPGDYWRYTTKDFERIFADFDTVVLEEDPQDGHPGVFYIGKKSKRKRTDLSKIKIASAPTE